MPSPREREFFTFHVMMRLLLRAAAAALAVLFVASCQKEVVEETYEPSESHENYRRAISELDLSTTEMGGAWLEAHRQALSEPTLLEPPAAEVVYFDPQDPSALGYRFPVSRGRAVEILIESEHDRYFADVFRVPDTDEEEPAPVASRPAGESIIRFEARSNEYYLLRLQPELLRGGRFEVRITTGASLAFPVEDAGAADIWSYFGDDRDGGRRLHHGVDIFAPRGTPVLATGTATVARVGRRDRGGKVVVLYDEARDIMLYYAHLEEQLAVEGTQVEAGDVIGTVGNSGNARTTPPHLHIGIYQGGWRRPVDPWAYFIDPTVTEPLPVDHDALIGSWAQAQAGTAASAVLPRPPEQEPAHANRNPFLAGAGDTFDGAEADLQSEPGAPPPPLVSQLAAGAAVRIVGASGDRIRVRTPAGESGYLGLGDLAAAGASGGGAGAPPGEIELDAPALLRDPRVGDAIGELAAGARVRRVGKTPLGDLVVLPSGRAAVLGGAADG